MRWILIVSLILAGIHSQRLIADTVTIETEFSDNSCISGTFSGYVSNYDGTHFTIFREQQDCPESSRETCKDFLYNVGGAMDHFVTTAESNNYYSYKLPKDRVLKIQFNASYSTNCEYEKFFKPTNIFQKRPEAVSHFNPSNDALQFAAKEIGTAARLATAEFKAIPMGGWPARSGESVKIEVDNLAAATSKEEIADGEAVLVGLGVFEESITGAKKFIVAEGFKMAAPGGASSAVLDVEKFWTMSDSTMDLEDLYAIALKAGPGGLNTTIVSKECTSRSSAEWKIFDEHDLKNTPIDLMTISVSGFDRTIEIRPPDGSECEMEREVSPAAYIYK